jgi:hypothetical protein
LDAADLVQLKQSGLSDALIGAMIQRSSVTTIAFKGN